MKRRLPLLVAGVIFFIVALAHLLRLLYRWELIIDGYVITMTVSVIAFIVATLLSLWMFSAFFKK